MKYTIQAEMNKIYQIIVQWILLKVDTLGPNPFVHIKLLAIQTKFNSKTLTFLILKSFYFAHKSHKIGKKC
jgi:hypothetical protein